MNSINPPPRLEDACCCGCATDITIGGACSGSGGNSDIGSAEAKLDSKTAGGPAKLHRDMIHTGLSLCQGSKTSNDHRMVNSRQPRSPMVNERFPPRF